MPKLTPHFMERGVDTCRLIDFPVVASGQLSQPFRKWLGEANDQMLFLISIEKWKNNFRHLPDVFGLGLPLSEDGTSWWESRRPPDVTCGAAILDGGAGNDINQDLGRVFRLPLWRWRKMVALPLPVAILDDLISGSANDVIHHGGRKRKGLHLAPPPEWGSKTRLYY